MAMNVLEQVLEAKIPLWRREKAEVLKRAGDRVVTEVRVGQIYRGLRGVESLLCDTSHVDPQQGLFIRGIHLDQLTERLPEEIFFLLCTGEFPTADQLSALQKDIGGRYALPDDIWRLLEQLPAEISPINVFSILFTALSGRSEFVRRYREGMAREDYWRAMLEDALTALARGALLTAAIYRRRVLGKEIIPPEPELDLAANLVHMMGIEKEKSDFQQLMRLFMVTHSDHEGGSVSVNTTRIVNSALSDLYLSVAAGMNGLAGPLHGMANQYSVRFVREILERFEAVPSDEALQSVVLERIRQGCKIPGFGHAVLRSVDPRFRAFFNFAQAHFPDDPLFQVIEKLNRLVPPLLRQHTEVQNPYPNIDLISGVMLYHYGLQELEIYPLMFGVSLLLGMGAQLVINRALMLPIFRPRSITTRRLKKIAGLEDND